MLKLNVAAEKALLSKTPNDFQLFFLPICYEIEDSVLDVRYHDLLKKTHPDVCGEANAAQYVKQLNQAFERLKNPLKRAIYFLSLYQVSGENSTFSSDLSTDFLMEQMALREQIQTIKTEGEKGALLTVLNDKIKGIEDDFIEKIKNFLLKNNQKDLLHIIKIWQFYEKCRFEAYSVEIAS